VSADRPRQLALDLPHSESLTRDNFLEGPSNAAALALIERWPDWPHRVMWLAGPEGAGKSHLAAIWADRTGAARTTAAALHEGLLPGLLAGVAVVVEDLDAGTIDQPSLFHLLNLVREHGTFLLLTARQPPTHLAISLPDLGSRLRAIPVVALGPPDDQLFLALLVKFCADRQMSVDAALVNYLASRIERSAAAARAAVAALDAEALRQRRPVTRALAAEVLRDQDGPAA
jgi:chromosomal replication initiation ATPase DnaA